MSNKKEEKKFKYGDTVWTILATRFTDNYGTPKTHYYLGGATVIDCGDLFVSISRDEHGSRILSQSSLDNTFHLDEVEPAKERLGWFRGSQYE